MGNHKEPWSIVDRGGNTVVDVDDAEGKTVLLSVHPDIARRIVACVNASVDLFNETLELAAKNGGGVMNGWRRAGEMEGLVDELRRENQELRQQGESKSIGARRYNWLRSRDLDTIGKGGVFAGMTDGSGSGGYLLSEEHLDKAVDDAMGMQPQESPTFTGQLTVPIPDILFDGNAVYEELTEKGRRRTGPEGVSDVLDAVVRILKRQGGGS